MERPVPLSGPAVAFGTFRLFVTQRVLTEGGQPVRLGSRALEILFALLEHPGEMVSKARLFQRVWSNVVVEEGTLRVHIAALRKVLGEGRSGARYIENVSGRGYRFVAPVSKLEHSGSGVPGDEVGAHSLLPTPLLLEWLLVGLRPSGGE